MNELKYSLCLRRGNKNYYPVEWTLLINKDLDRYNLENIDNYTKEINEEELRIKLLDANYINEAEYGCPFIIIYMEKDNIRILNEGPIFSNKKEALDFKRNINLIINNITDREEINRIYNYMSKYQKNNKNLQEFLHIINKYKEYNQENLNELILTKYNKLNYIDKRRIGVYIANNIIIRDIIN